MTRKSPAPAAVPAARTELDELTNHVLAHEQVAIAVALAASRLAFTGADQERVGGALAMVAVAGYLAGIAGARQIEASATTIDAAEISVERDGDNGVVLVQGNAAQGEQRKIRFDARHANAVAGAVLAVAAEMA